MFCNHFWFVGSALLEFLWFGKPRAQAFLTRDWGIRGGENCWWLGILCRLVLPVVVSGPREVAHTRPWWASCQMCKNFYLLMLELFFPKVTDFRSWWPQEHPRSVLFAPLVAGRDVWMLPLMSSLTQELFNLLSFKAVVHPNLSQQLHIV